MPPDEREKRRYTDSTCYLQPGTATGKRQFPLYYYLLLHVRGQGLPSILHRLKVCFVVIHCVASHTFSLSLSLSLILFIPSKASHILGCVPLIWLATMSYINIVGTQAWMNGCIAPKLSHYYGYRLIANDDFGFS